MLHVSRYSGSPTSTAPCTTTAAMVRMEALAATGWARPSARLSRTVQGGPRRGVEGSLGPGRAYRLGVSTSSHSVSFHWPQHDGTQNTGLRRKRQSHQLLSLFTKATPRPEFFPIRADVFCSSAPQGPGAPDKYALIAMAVRDGTGLDWTGLELEIHRHTIRNSKLLSAQLTSSLCCAAWLCPLRLCPL